MLSNLFYFCFVFLLQVDNDTPIIDTATARVDSDQFDEKKAFEIESEKFEIEVKTYLEKSDVDIVIENPDDQIINQKEIVSQNMTGTTTKRFKLQNLKSLLQHQYNILKTSQ